MFNSPFKAEEILISPSEESSDEHSGCNFVLFTGKMSAHCFCISRISQISKLSLKYSSCLQDFNYSLFLLLLEVSNPMWAYLNKEDLLHGNGKWVVKCSKAGLSKGFDSYCLQFCQLLDQEYLYTLVLSFPLSEFYTRYLWMRALNGTGTEQIYLLLQRHQSDLGLSFIRGLNTR